MSQLKQLILKLIPKTLLDIYALKPFTLISELLDAEAMISYSQQGEDLAVLKHFGRRFGGTFVDVGAFHPSKFSNTKIFYKMGWTGINIEPNPDNFKLFERDRPRDINLNLAIGHSQEKLRYYAFNNATVNTFNKEHADLWKSREGFNIVKELEIEIFPLSEIFKKHLGGRQIDFMSVDVEGMDLEVLKSNDWDLYSPTMLLVEDGDVLTYSSYMDCPIYAYLLTKGYRLLNIAGITLIFIKNDKA